MPKNAEAKPRYLQLRERLTQDISAGIYPVGSLFPTEAQIAQTYQVSRHTVREATRTLAERGLIAKRAGFGTVVCAQEAATPFIAALGSMDELFKYTQDTRLEVLQRKQICADASMALSLGCERDSVWIVLTTQRLALQRSTAISFTQVYLRPEFVSVADQLHGQHKSIFKMLEEDHHQRIGQVQQDIEAKLMPLKASKLLGVPKNSPALHLRRAYLDSDGRLLAVSSNLYAASRFRLKTSWLISEPVGKKKNSKA